MIYFVDTDFRVDERTQDALTNKIFASINGRLLLF